MFAIEYVVSVGPAHEAGLVSGQVITEVNGTKAGDITKDMLGTMMTSEGLLLRLHVEDEGKGFDVTLTMRRLI